MTVKYKEDKEGNTKYSGDIQHTSTHMGPFGNEKGKFETSLFDVRDGEFVEVDYKNKHSKKNYTKLQAVGVRAEANMMEKLSNQAKGSKFIPKKQTLQF